MTFDVIDFHCHPFVCNYERIGGYVDTVNMTTEDFFKHMEENGVSFCVGSVIGRKTNSFEDIHNFNLHALKLRQKYHGKYIPGFHIHPFYIEKSIKEIDFAIENNVKLIGELVPYHHGWEDYSSPEFMEVMSYINGKNLIVNMHISSKEDLEQMEKPIAAYKDIKFVLAHPGYGDRLNKHIEILNKYENTYLDLSGSGIELYGAVKRIVESTDFKRLLFGTDFPVTAVGTWKSAVLNEKISEDAKEHILSKNARRLLNLERSQT